MSPNEILLRYRIVFHNSGSQTFGPISFMCSVFYFWWFPHIFTYFYQVNHDKNPPWPAKKPPWESPRWQLFSLRHGDPLSNKEPLARRPCREPSEVAWAPRRGSLWWFHGRSTGIFFVFFWDRTNITSQLDVIWFGIWVRFFSEKTWAITIFER